ncbi:hypothetical protein PV08_04160 [Exophiala spinifera]|uniref:Xylanolytic transcriptional activator regulatory domain-containing protein n=1 Tax=Exophiala spinifera TaxID=91928 RepID=A0A0D2C057_9EURO|nr:uncharacterized protein PV08_04160 [Exophiala spinifera]KIW16969.1 hypothetical protein PV08_04160 [Exophiala spinifera]
MPSKLSAVHAALGIELPAERTANVRQPLQAPRHVVQSSKGRHLHLPEPAEFEGLLQVYWSEHNPFFPCMNRTDFQLAIHRWLSAAGYGPSSTTVQILPKTMILAANLCMVLAIAEFVDPQRVRKMSGSSVGQWVSGKQLHETGSAILKHCEPPSHEQEIDAIRFHILEAMYLVYVERLRQASAAIGVAVQLTFRTGLHDQSSWTDLAPTAVDSRRILFWCVYYMDRRISEKTGQPYLLRDEEVGVAEIYKPGSHEPSVLINGDSESVAFNTAMCHYLQHIIDWAHLWTDIWDTLFSIRAQKLVGDVGHHSRSIDHRIDRMLGQLPHELQWQREQHRSNPSRQEGERQARFALLAYTRLNTAQLLLHHNPFSRVRASSNTLDLRLKKAVEMVNAIVLHLETFDTYSQLGQWACAVLVECIYHIVPVVASNISDSDRNKAVSALHSIKALMENLSTSQGSARRAQRALKRVFSVVERGDNEHLNDSTASAQKKSSAPHLQVSDGAERSMCSAALPESPLSPWNIWSDWDFSSQMDSFFRLDEEAGARDQSFSPLIFTSLD